jgi:hypothetical protein
VLPFLPLPTLGSGGKAGPLPPGNAPGAMAPGGGGTQAQSSDTATSTPQPSGGQQ